MKSKIVLTSIILFALVILPFSVFSKEIKKEADSKVSTKNVSTETLSNTTTNTVTVNPVLTKKDESQTKSLAGEKIDWFVISSGGSTGTSANFTLSGTIGQTAVGEGTSSNYIILSGFWQDFSTGATGCCIGVRGNFDGDPIDQVDIGDIVYMVEYQFGTGPAVPCFEEGDSAPNAAPDGQIDIGDLVEMVEYQFDNGPPPPAC